MATLHEKVREKQKIMRELYGGMMTATDLSKELGMKRENAKVWALEHGLGNLIGKRVKFETDEVARRIVEMRGMC